MNPQDAYKGSGASSKPPEGGSGVKKKRRTIKNPQLPPDNVTVEQAREAANVAGKKRS